MGTELPPPVVVQAHSATDLFRTAVEAVLEKGLPVSPRGLPTREIIGAVLQLSRPRNRYVHVPGVRVLNTAFAVAEAVWIVSGSDGPWIFGYNSRLAQFADDGVLQGAYGARMRHWARRPGLDQLAQVVALLRDDPDTRRAVIQLYDPSRDAEGHRDVPCSLNYRFHLRNGSLHMTTTMRSQDVWLGLPYDLFTATMLHELVAGWVDAQLGTYTVCIDSLHLYEEDLLSARQVAETSPTEVQELAPLTATFTDLDTVLAGVVDGTLATEDPGWKECRDVLASYRAWTAGDRVEAQRIADLIEGPLGGYLNAWYDHLRDAQRSRSEAGDE